MQDERENEMSISCEAVQRLAAAAGFGVGHSLFFPLKYECGRVTTDTFLTRTR